MFDFSNPKSKTPLLVAVGPDMRESEEAGSDGPPMVTPATLLSFSASSPTSTAFASAMAETGTVGTDSAAEMVEQLGKAFIELESHREASTSFGILWEEIKEHFNNLESSYKKRLAELEEKEKAFEEKKSGAKALIAEREAAVAAKEQALLDPIQELKDAAVAAIVEARKKCNVEVPQVTDASGNKQNKVSIPVDGDHNAPISASEEKSPNNKSGEFADAVAVEVKPRPQLKQLCEQMDAKGLIKYLSENRKNLAREEIPIALKSAEEPARLVLNSLEGFYPPDQTTSLGNEDTVLQGLRRTCIFLMESAAPLWGMGEPGGDHPLSSEIKQQAKAIADEWKPKLAGVDIDAPNGNSLEAQAFLQLVATFSIASEFDEDELCKLVLAVSRRRQAPGLCRSVGIVHKMPGVVEALVNSGKQIDAVHFAHAFQLFESFPPVPLLKAYLKDLRRNAQEKGGNAGVAGGQDANSQELGALRAVIRCVEDYKLQADYPPEPLQKRVSQLEKAKTDKKRMGEAAKYQSKKPRGYEGYAPRVHAVAAENRQTKPQVFDDGGLYYGGSERYPYNVSAPAPASYNYQMPTHSSYGPPAQANAQRQYYYPDGRAPPAPYSGSSGYGSYTNPGLPPSHQPYM